MIEVNEVRLGKEEIKNVVDALSRDKISGNKGTYIDLFQKSVAAYCDTEYGVSTSSGTAALHLALIALGIKKGDEVLIPNLTMAATAFAVIYTGAEPIPVDVDMHTWNIDANLIESSITDKTKAIIPVHLYGNPCDMDRINKIADEYNLYVIEDCAEALGAEYKHKRVGGFGIAGCHSFYASKMITTGEGGMITTNNSNIRNDAESYKNMAFGVNHRYLHEDIGYNYRLTNIQSAIGLAQMRMIDNTVTKKRNLHSKYRNELQRSPMLEFQDEAPDGRSVWWMNAVLADEPNKIRKRLDRKGIRTGDVFYPIHRQPFIDDKELYPVSDEISEKGFLLPSSIYLHDDDIKHICKVIDGGLNA